MKIIKDGSAYCVQANNFKNLQESKDYFFIEKNEYQDFIRNIQENAVIRELSHWASFFDDPLMNAMTPSERLRERIEKLR